MVQDAFADQQYTQRLPAWNTDTIRSTNTLMDLVIAAAALSAGGVRRQASNRVKPFLLSGVEINHARYSRRGRVVNRAEHICFHTTVWFKNAGAGNYVPWHQDATYFGLYPYEHVTAWVALTDSAENGCVEVCPDPQFWSKATS